MQSNPMHSGLQCDIAIINVIVGHAHVPASLINNEWLSDMGPVAKWNGIMGMKLWMEWNYGNEIVGMELSE